MTALPPDCPVTALGYSLDFATGYRKHYFRTPAGDVARVSDVRLEDRVELLFDGEVDYAARCWPPRDPPRFLPPEAFNRCAAAAALRGASLAAGLYRSNKNGGARPGVTVIASGPGDTTSGPSTSDERSAGWHCGNGGLRARATLTLIERNAIRDPEAIEAINALVYEAGAKFAADILADDQVPF